jgi:ATP-dependent Lon protease
VLKKKLAKTQKEYFLREQIKAIKSELGDEGVDKDEFTELREKLSRKA